MLNDLVEVWLIDTGHFLVLERLHKAWTSHAPWVALMTKRRLLRLWIMREEIGSLEGIERTFDIAKGAVEFCELAQRGRDNQINERRRLSGVLETAAIGAETYFAQKALDAHDAARDGVDRANLSRLLSMIASGRPKRYDYGAITVEPTHIHLSTEPSSSPPSGRQQRDKRKGAPK